jgi:hypothetical protein
VYDYGEDDYRTTVRLLSLDVVGCEQLAHVEASATDVSPKAATKVARPAAMPKASPKAVAVFTPRPKKRK